MPCPWIRACALTLALALPASAQHREKNVGLSIAVGFAKASLRQSCDCGSLRSLSAFGFAFRGGWSLAHRVLIGAEFLLWEHNEIGDLEERSTRFDYASAFALWYPAWYQEFFLKAGAGFARVSRPVTFEGGVRDVDATSPAFHAGTGIDLNIAGSWSATPYVDFVFTLPARARVEGESNRVDLSSGVVTFGVVLVWP